MTVAAYVNTAGGAYLVADTRISDESGTFMCESHKIHVLDWGWLVAAGHVHLERMFLSKLDSELWPAFDYWDDTVVGAVRSAMSLMEAPQAEESFEAIVVTRETRTAYYLNFPGDIFMHLGSCIAIGEGSSFAYGYLSSSMTGTQTSESLEDMVLQCSKYVSSVGERAQVVSL